MLEAGAASFVVKGAPLWELERALQGRASPSCAWRTRSPARSASERDRLSRPRDERAHGRRPRRRLPLVRAGARSGRMAGRPSTRSPTRGRADAGRRSARARRGATRCCRRPRADRALPDVRRAGSAATAVPLLADGERLGVLLIVMPANVQFDLDDDLVGALADIAAGDLSSRRKLALSQAEARRTPSPTCATAPSTSISRRSSSRQRAGRPGRPRARRSRRVQGDQRHEGARRRRPRARRHRQRPRCAARTGEEVFRIGGDEFAVVVRGDADAAARAAERFRQAVESSDGPEALPAISVGVAVVPRARSGEGGAPRARRRGALRQARPKPCRRLRAEDDITPAPRSRSLRPTRSDRPPAA